MNQLTAFALRIFKKNFSINFIKLKIIYKFFHKPKKNFLGQIFSLYVYLCIFHDICIFSNKQTVVANKAHFSFRKKNKLNNNEMNLYLLKDL